MDTLFARQRHLAEQERLLLADLRRFIPDPQAREPIEQSVREGLRRERRNVCIGAIFGTNGDQPP